MPLVGSLALGVPLYVFPSPFAKIAGFSTDDTYIYELGGAAMLGYTVALALGLRSRLWSPMRFVVLGTYVFAAIGFLAGFAAFASNEINGFVVVVTLWAVVVTWAVAQILVAHRGAIAGPRDVAVWVVLVLGLATLTATAFGLGSQFPRPSPTLTGYTGSSDYVYRFAGGACLGYAAMGIQELRSRHWDDIRLPNVTALVFSGLAFLASVFEMLAGRASIPVVFIGIPAGFFTVSIALILVRRGR